MKFLSIFVIWTIILFIVLFSPNGLQLGTSLGDVHVFFITLAAIFGNLLWIVGLLAIIGAGFLLALTFFDDVMLKMVNEMKDKGTYSKMIKPKWYRIPITTITVMLALFSIGSGFWFFGTAWLFTAVTFYIFKKGIIRIGEKDNINAEHKAKVEKNSLTDSQL